MFTLARNAAGIDAEYLNGLGTCFPGAWNEATYRWFLKRRFRSREPDTISVHRERLVVGGLGVNYREVRSPNGCLHDVGVLTAAWLLPKYQGRGGFRRMVDAAIEVATANGCVTLLSFVVQGNASALGLRRLGATAVPTRYLFLAPSDAFAPPPCLPCVRARPPDRPTETPASASGIAFHYASREEWAEQFVDRPNRTTLYSIECAAAVVEHVGPTDRLQFLWAPPGCAVQALLAMANRSHAEGRSFFFFTADCALADRAAALGLRQTHGALMMLDLPRAANHADVRAWAHVRWNVQPGDRM